ncbi:MAG: rRNA maturation RNase YbeY [Leptolyngbya sp. SIO4C1]|nr:rRNA maturation RNase YbeY [Leptolyngbya sp. SIO4C1]
MSIKPAESGASESAVSLSAIDLPAAAPSSKPYPTVELYLESQQCPATADLSEATWQRWLAQWLAVLSPQLSPIDAYELSLIFTDDAGIQQLNASYRQQDKPTDVLAFAALENTLPGREALDRQLPLYLGDIIISTETAARQAAELGHAVRQELIWLAAHGLLHLLGWDHPDEASLRAMLAQQTTLLTLISENG